MSFLVSLAHALDADVAELVEPFEVVSRRRARSGSAYDVPKPPGSEPRVGSYRSSRSKKPKP